MKGYIKNTGDRSLFVLQRTIYPGFSITLDEAYKVVGKKSGKKRGISFVKWLRENYFKNLNWVIYKDAGEEYFFEDNQIKAVRSESARGGGKNLVRRDDARAKEAVTVENIIQSDIVAAKQLIDKCGDRSVLKKALAASKHISKKEAHMRYLIRRLEQVYF